VQAPPPAAPQGPASIKFWADDEDPGAGKCTRLHWEVDNVREVYLDGQGVTGHGDKQVCPTQKTTYTLHVVKVDGSTEDKRVTVKGQPAEAAGPPAPPGGGSWGQAKADLEPFDIELNTWPDGIAFFKVKNHGPDTLHDGVDVVCSVKVYRYCSNELIRDFDDRWSGKHGNDLKPGDSWSGLEIGDVFTSEGRYEIQCTVSSELADPNPGNNTVSKSFGSKRCL
jgi:hypothetical protein